MQDRIYEQNCIKQRNRVFLNAFNTQEFTRRNIPLMLAACFALIVFVTALSMCDRPLEYFAVYFAIALTVLGAKNICLRWLQDYTKFVCPLHSRITVGEERIKYNSEFIKADGTPAKRETVFEYSKLRALRVEKRRHAICFMGEVSFYEDGKELRTIDGGTVIVTYAFRNRREEKAFMEDLLRAKLKLRREEKEAEPETETE